MNQTDLRDKLREAQQHLADAARAIDGATVHVRTALNGIDKQQQGSHGDGDTDGKKGD